MKEEVFKAVFNKDKKPAIMTGDAWDGMDQRAHRTIKLSLMDEVMCNVMSKTSAT